MRCRRQLRVTAYKHWPRNLRNFNQTGLRGTRHRVAITAIPGLVAQIVTTALVGGDPTTPNSSVGAFSHDTRKAGPLPCRFLRHNRKTFSSLFILSPTQAFRS